MSLAIVRSLRLPPASLVALILAGSAGPAAAHDPAHDKAPPRAVLEDFEKDPTAAKPSKREWKNALFQTRGDADRFAWEAKTAERFEHDKHGSLRVTYDSSLPTARYFTTFGDGAFTDEDDFVFGAVLTIREDGFHADPFGFAQITFSLWDSNRTGDERTGTPQDFSVNTYSSLEFDYFPNVSPFFGGPFVSPSVFGEPLGDAFANFAFNSAAATLEPGRTYHVELSYTAETRLLRASVWELPGKKDKKNKRPIPRPDAGLTVDLSGISGFSADSLGIAAFRDGFNEFAPSGKSLTAVVDYDLIYAGRPTDKPLAEVRRRLRDR